MPGQVFQVVQCYSCHTFQVQQRKKVNKWVCKMCGEKQSIKKVYGEGSGADCRVHVQKLNTLRGELDHSQQLVMHHSAHREPEMGQCDLGQSDLQYSDDNQLASRWSQFMDDATHIEEGDDDDDNDHRWTTDSKMYKESMKRGMKRKKSHSETFSSRHSLKGDNSFTSTYTSHSTCSWDDYNSHVEHRHRENVPDDKLYHNYQSPDDNNCHLPDQRLQNSSRNIATLCSASGKMMPSIQKKQKPSNEGAAVNSKWLSFIDNEESEDSDCSESTMRLGKSEFNPECDSLSSLADGHGAASKWTVFVDGVPPEPSLPLEESSNTEASNSTLRSYRNVSGVSMTCFHGDDVIGQSSHRQLSPGDSNGQQLSKTSDKDQAVPEHQKANTRIDRGGLVLVKGKENRPHKQTSSIFSVGDVDDADLELDF